MLVAHFLQKTRLIASFKPFPSQICCLHTLCHSPSPRLKHASHLPVCPSRFRQARGKKTKASIKLDDLPQGVIPLEPLQLEQDAPQSLPTVVLQARNNMRKFENCVLLTRVGGFYELYFEHAEEYGPLLNLKVADKKAGGGVVSMVFDLLSSLCGKVSTC